MFTGKIKQFSYKVLNKLFPYFPQNSFLGAFAKFNTYTILWRMEKSVAGAEKLEHLHLVKWLPQKDIMRHPKMKLMIAHGGYNSFLEAAQAGIPAVLMPLFADQKSMRNGLNDTEWLRFLINLPEL
uniref:UDP-glucuronosyltransferase n=1 Tax=Caenorhabditis japonica TaxID=281687 RepID=A0A8R1E9T2_CAEJA